MRPILIALVCAASVPAAAAIRETAPPAGSVIAVGDWTYVGSSETTVMFVKAAPAAGSYRRVYVRFEDGVPFTRDDFGSSSSLELDDIDCQGQKTRIVESVRYAAHNMTGESRPDAIEPMWKSEAPGSFGAGLLAKVCSSAD